MARKTEQPSNIVAAIQAECTRVRSVILLYRKLPGHVGSFASAWQTALINRAEKAVAANDVVECVTCLKLLKEVKY